MQTARASDGTALQFELRGEGPGKPRIALIHSLGLGRLVWDRVSEQLVDRAQVLVYDCRGHGASAKPAGPYTLELFASDLVALLDHVGWDTAAVAGCSMGGSVSLRFVTSYPQRVSALGLIDTTSWYGPEAEKSWDERAERAHTHGLTSMIDFQETRWFSDAFRAEHPEIVARCREAFLANDIEAYAATCSMLGRFDLRAQLGSIAVPTAIAVGEEDYATTPAMAAVLHEGIAGSTLETIPAGRHITPLERPDVIAAMLRALIGRASA